jgi:hypothetical protein
MNTPLAVPRSALGADLRGLSTELLTTVAGLLAAGGMIGLNVLTQRTLDLDLLGVTFEFIFPVGAFIGGLGAALGYYAAARATQTLPSRRMLFEMLAIAFSTWMFVHWVEYATLRMQNGTLVRDSIPFWDYLRIRTEHLHLVFDSTMRAPADSTSDLGLLGYVHELIQIAGFLLGGFIVWLALRAREACVPCSRYARTLRLLQRAPTAAFDAMLQRCGVALPAIGERVARAAGHRRLVGLNLSIATCPSCRRSWLRPDAVVFDRGTAIVRALDPYDVTPAQAAALLALAPGTRG